VQSRLRSQAQGEALTLASAIAEVFPEIKLLPQQNAARPENGPRSLREKQETWPIQYLGAGRRPDPLARSVFSVTS